jgi:valyl-tRNA synthetase
MPELAKQYNPKEVEEKIYQWWESSGFFHASINPDKAAHTIVIPPPNITGILHMGHILNNTLQDVFTRWKRMQGFEACWIPGTDHAGIATQNVVEKALRKEGTSLRELGREKFIDRVWEWKTQYGGTINKQLRTLGVSCDWERERFTMDEGLSNAVKEVFVQLYDKGLIYKGKYIVNWCPREQTALSDDEVNSVESIGHLWYIKYAIENSDEFIVVATTRPETMLGDTAIAVNPKDERYKDFVGKNAIVPIAHRVIPIVADDFVDPAFGTGAVKVTPAHDANDYQTGIRLNLPQIIIMDTSATMNANVPAKYQGLDRYECRRELLRDLEKQHLLIKTDDHFHNVGHCYRCDTVIEPYLSDQWFVKMKPLAEPALKAVQDGKIKFYPERFVKTYEHWMTNIRDWCISRQLWWGHRIPAYYLPDGTIIVARNIQEAGERLKAKGSRYSVSDLKQDEDVLDTWFSSWLWPLSVHDWPNETDDLKYFYPTDVLVTAPDIIFFWVARMIMAGLEFKGEVPFRHVYFTSLIRDSSGRKMSKSLGNSPDPIDVISTYGADALRFTVLFLAPVGQDVLYDNDKCEIGRNFANKIWNAARFLMMHRDQLPAENELTIAPSAASEDMTDRWIISRFSSTVRDVTVAMDNFRVNDAVKLLYDFLWKDFCDWYVEFVKNRLQETSDVHLKRTIINRALKIYEETLKLLHPFMPFVTEEIFQHLSQRKSSETIMQTLMPQMSQTESQIDTDIERQMDFLQNVILAVRQIRSEMNIPMSKTIDFVASCNEFEKQSILENNRNSLQKLLRLETMTIGIDLPKPGYAASSVVKGQEIFIPLKGLIDTGIERDRLQKEIDRLEGQLRGVMAKLNNENFVGKAAPDVIEKEKNKQQNFEQTIQKLKVNLEQLVG